MRISGKSYRLFKPRSRWMIKTQRSPRVWKIWALEALVNSSGHPRVGLRMNSQVQRGKQEGEFSMRDLTPRDHHQLSEEPEQCSSKINIYSSSIYSKK